MNKNRTKKYLLKALICSMMLSSASYTTALAATNPPINHTDGMVHDYEDRVEIDSIGGTDQAAVTAKNSGGAATTINFKQGLAIDLNNVAAGATARGLWSDGFSKISIAGGLDINMSGAAGSLMHGIVGNATIAGGLDINMSGAAGSLMHGIVGNTTIAGGVNNIVMRSSADSDIIRGVSGRVELTNNAQLNIDVTDINKQGVPGWRKKKAGFIGNINMEQGSQLNIKLDMGTAPTFAPFDDLNGGFRRMSNSYTAEHTPAGLYIGNGRTATGVLQDTYIEVSGAPIGFQVMAGVPPAETDFSGKASAIGGVVGLGAHGSVTAEGNLIVKVTSPRGVGIRVDDNNSAGGLMYKGQINLNGNTIIETNNGFALMSETIAVPGDGGVSDDKRYSGFGSDRPTLENGNYSRININQNGGKLVQITGDLDHRTAYLSYYKLNLDRADSFLRGSSMKSNNKEIARPPEGNPATPEGYTDITLVNGATWYMTGKSDNNKTGNSIVNILTLNNKGYIDMTPSGTSGYEKLTAAELHGNGGRLLMNTDLQQSFDNKNVMADSDRLVITGKIRPTDPIKPSETGTHTIDVKDASLLTKIASEGYLLLVQDQSQGNAKFVGGELQKGGIFKYKPIITDDAPAPGSGYINVPADSTNWYLTGFEKLEEIQDEVILQAGLAESRYTSYMNEQDTLIKRLGELRQHDKEKGIWVRVRGANNSVDGYGINRNSYVSTHLGYDWRLDDQKKTKRYRGVAFNHTNNNFDYALGASGKGQSNVLTLYGTNLGDKGHYLDIVGKIGRMSNDYKYQDHTVAAKNWFYSLSAEYGRSIVRDKGWYYEPQVQFTLGRINGTSYNANGTHVDADGITSAILRGGILAGRKFNEDKQEKLGSYYAKVFYNYEFGGNVKAKMSDTFGDSFNFSHNYKGGWLTVGVGTSLNLNKKTNLYLDVEKAFGGKVSGGWAWQGGVRWRF